MKDKVLMSTDTEGYNNRLREMSKHLDIFNDVFIAYKTLNLPSLSLPEFKRLMQHPADLVFTKMTNNEPLTLNGLPVNRQKALELVMMPDGFKELEELIGDFKKRNPHLLQSLSYIDMEDEEIVVSESVKASEMENYNHYAITDDEKALHDFAQDVIAAAQARFGKEKAIPLVPLIERSITVSGLLGDVSPRKYHIRGHAIKGFEQNN